MDRLANNPIKVPELSNRNETSKRLSIEKYLNRQTTNDCKEAFADVFKDKEFHPVNRLPTGIDLDTSDDLYPIP
jgi:hypothetical protein